MTEAHSVAPVKGRFSKLSLALMALSIFIIFFNGFFLIFHVTGGPWEALSRLVIVPAAFVNGEFVSYHQVAELTNGILEENLGESHHDAFQTALSRSVENAAVLSLAKKLNVDIAGAESSAPNDGSFESEYMKKPLLLARATEEAVYADTDYQTEVQNRLLDLRARIVGGMPFADAAKKFSEDVTGGSGGDLGVFTLEALPVWLAPVARIDYNDVSDVLNGPDAFWLATVYEHGGTEAEPWIRLRGLALKKTNLSEVIAANFEANPPWVFVW